MRPNNGRNRAPGGTNPVWRYSNPDSHYGFRIPAVNPPNRLPTSGTTPAGNSICLLVVCKQRNVNKTIFSDLSHYAHVPTYLWGPPPPYSQPLGANNTDNPSGSGTNQSTVAEVNNPAATTDHVASTYQTGNETNNVTSGREAPRTSRSGLLQSGGESAEYDETVKSAYNVIRKHINSNRYFHLCSSCVSNKTILFLFTVCPQEGCAKPTRLLEVSCLAINPWLIYKDHWQKRRRLRSSVKSVKN